MAEVLNLPSIQSVEHAFENWMLMIDQELEPDLLKHYAFFIELLKLSVQALEKVNQLPPSREKGLLSTWFFNYHKLLLEKIDILSGYILESDKKSSDARLRLQLETSLEVTQVADIPGNGKQKTKSPSDIAWELLSMMNPEPVA